MFKSLRRESISEGVALFRGNLPPSLESFDQLEAQGIKVEPLATGDEAQWSAVLTHREWGSATAFCPKRFRPMDRLALDFDPRLSEQEVDAIVSCASGVYLEHTGKRANVLRDRKHMLRFARALMADDGVAFYDGLSMTGWMPEALDDELAHDADLDIEALYVIHAVQEEEGGCEWAHTHGLGELGFFDFDILGPSEDVTGQASSLFRAIAFGIVGGDITASCDNKLLMSPNRAIRMVDASKFQRAADRRWAGIRDDPGGSHTISRSVVCNPVAGWRKWLGGGVRPSVWMQRPMQDPGVIFFSNAATDVMAARALQTYPALRKLAAEFAEFGFPVLIKLGYTVDGGGPTDREHLWFEVHEMRDDSIDATLINQPFNISNMNEGDRGEHPIDLISEWTMFTPAGQIGPQWTAAARFIRANPEVIREAMAEHEEGGVG